MHTLELCVLAEIKYFQLLTALITDLPLLPLHLRKLVLSRNIYYLFRSSEVFLARLSSVSGSEKALGPRV